MSVTGKLEITVASVQMDVVLENPASLDLNEQHRKRLSYNYFRDRKPLLYNNLVDLG